MTGPNMHTVLSFLCLAFLVGCSDKNTPTAPPTVGPPQFPLSRYFDYPAWHPGGEWIAANHSDNIDMDGDGKRDLGFAGIWLVHAQTGTKQPLIRGYNLPAWSRDGRKFAMVKGGPIFTVEVVSLQPARIDSNSLVQITSEGRNFFPGWIPDGEWIAYDNTLEIFGLTSLNRIDSSATNNYYPCYSPDGKKIAISSKPCVGPPAIRMTNSVGANLRKASTDYAWRYDWSPDGKKFVFLYLKYENRDHPGNGQLPVANTDGTASRQLTHFKKFHPDERKGRG